MFNDVIGSTLTDTEKNIIHITVIQLDSNLATKAAMHQHA